MLNFDPEWRFQPPRSLSSPAVDAFESLINRLTDAGRPLGALEHFKRYFAAAAGTAYISSSSASWARSDLALLMESAASNAPLFIEAFYEACRSLEAQQPGPALPLAVINRVLSENDTGFQIDPPDLKATFSIQHVAFDIPAPSLEAQAQSLIQQSLGQIQQAVSERRSRQAVQESLWLLETVTTVFRGEAVAQSTIQGKYFNKIVEELKRDRTDPTLPQVINWILALHGYLSSPTGGGIRHGADINANLRLSDNDALLYCNLTRSYIAFLLGEYERIKASPRL